MSSSESGTASHEDDIYLSEDDSTTDTCLICLAYEQEGRLKGFQFDVAGSAVDHEACLECDVFKVDESQLCDFCNHIRPAHLMTCRRFLDLFDEEEDFPSLPEYEVVIGTPFELKARVGSCAFCQWCLEVVQADARQKLSIIDEGKAIRMEISLDVENRDRSNTNIRWEAYTTTIVYKAKSSHSAAGSDGRKSWDSYIEIGHNKDFVRSSDTFEDETLVDPCRDISLITSVVDWAAVSQWISRCEQEHGTCVERSSGQLPDHFRLIDVAKKRIIDATKDPPPFFCAELQLVIVAACGEDMQSGLAGIDFESPREQYQFTTGVFGFTMANKLQNFYFAMRCKWNERGWTYQEAVLGRRKLYFTSVELWFECAEGLKRENPFSTTSYQPYRGNHLTAYGSRDIQSSSDIFEEYGHHVEQYSRRVLTYPSDIYHAFHGIEDAFYPESQIIFGLPESDFNQNQSFSDHPTHRQFLALAWAKGCIDAEVPTDLFRSGFDPGQLQPNSIISAQDLKLRWSTIQDFWADVRDRQHHGKDHPQSLGLDVGHILTRTQSSIMNVEFRSEQLDYDTTREIFLIRPANTHRGDDEIVGCISSKAEYELRGTNMSEGCADVDFIALAIGYMSEYEVRYLDNETLRRNCFKQNQPDYSFRDDQPGIIVVAVRWTGPVARRIALGWVTLQGWVDSKPEFRTVILA
ncbi:hypothetical protein G7054_g12816 [Neopestalotiopsis clavispora]|nr:hypothetical protein G7054_g12816 [Neopestalotiopsis clavispora]